MGTEMRYFCGPQGFMISLQPLPALCIGSYTQTHRPAEQSSRGGDSEVKVKSTPSLRQEYDVF